MIAVRVIAVEPKLAIQSNSDTKINDGTGGQMICKVASLLMLRLPFSLAPDDVTFLDASVVRVISGGAGGVGMRDPHSVDTEVERRPRAGLVFGAARIARHVERGFEQLVDRLHLIRGRAHAAPPESAGVVLGWPSFRLSSKRFSNSLFRLRRFRAACSASCSFRSSGIRRPNGTILRMKLPFFDFIMKL